MEILPISATNAALIGAGSAAAVTAATFGIRRLIQMGQFSYLNARLSTVGTPYVLRENVFPLSEMDSPQAIAKSLMGPIRVDDSVSTFREADASLIRSFNDEMSSLAKDSPSIVEPLVSAFMARYEAEELKRLVRSVGKREDPLYPVGSIDGDIEKAVLSSPDMKSSLEHLENHPVGEVLDENIDREGFSLMQLDIALDRYAVNRIREVKGMPRYCRRGVRAVSDLLHDRYNLGVVIQSKALDVERERILEIVMKEAGSIGGEMLDQMIESADVKEAVNVLSGTYVEPFIKEKSQKGVTQIEVGLDRMLLSGSVALSQSFYGNVGPTIRYVIGKEMELKNLRTIFRSSFSGWDHSRTREFMIFEEDFS